jgi:hypothetical protein
MKRILLTIVALGLGLLLSACGGVGAPYHGPTDFQGAFVGFWNLDTETEFGTMTLTVAGDASAKGVFRDQASGKEGSLSGRVDRDGTFLATVTYQDGTTAKISAKIQGSGTGDTAGLSGDGTYRDDSGTSGFTFDVSHVSASPYNGSFEGSFAASDHSFDGTLFLSVGVDGRIAGTFSDTVSGANGAVEGAVQPDGKVRLVFKPGGTSERNLGVGVVTLGSTNLAGSFTYTPEGGVSKAVSFNLLSKE